MVDRLRQALDQLEPPGCASCHVDMHWFRSALTSQDPVVIVHLFVCPNCNRTSERTSTSPRAAVPPAKLSAPRSAQPAFSAMS